MQDCEVCGRSFDPFAFQVVVPELGRGFDRVECARSARALATPAGRVPAAPLVAIVEPGSGLLPTAAGPRMRPLAAPAATLAVLAVGTAAAAFLWLRVLGPDTASFPLSRAAPPPAFGHETVQAHVQAAPVRQAVSVKPEPWGRPVSQPARALLAAGRGGRAPGTGTHPSRSLLTARPDLSRTATPFVTSEDAKGKGHLKHGKGHYKHGETDGRHRPGHGHHGKHGHGQHGKHGHGHGNSKHKG